MSRALKPLVETDELVLFTSPVGPFAMNQSLLGCKKTGEAVLIDAGEPPQRFLEAARQRELSIKAVLQTHAHVDHVAGLGPTLEAIPVPVYLHAADLPIYRFVPQQAQLYGFPVPPLPEIEHLYADGDSFTVGDLELQILHTPGHSPGHVCLYAEAQGLLIGGDLLFRGSIGRTDLPFCDPQQMGISLRRIFTLPDPTLVIPGHGEPTTIGHERASNWIAKQVMQGA